MQEAIELLKKVLANEGDIGMHIEWNVGFREGIEHCIATLEAAQQSVQSDKCPDCGGSGFMVKIDNRKVSCSYCNGTGICR